MIRFTDDKWSDYYPPTICFGLGGKTLDIDGKSIRLKIWDTSGLGIYWNTNSSYYKGAQGIMLVYDITDLESFEDLNKCFYELEKNAPKNAYKILVGNKCDLESERKVTVKQGEDFAVHYDMNFIETSSKESINVSEAFINMTRDIINPNNINKVFYLNTVIQEMIWMKTFF